MALLTGEAEPVPVGPGDRVVAGSILLDGALTVQVEAVGGETDAEPDGSAARAGRRSRHASHRSRPHRTLVHRARRWSSPAVTCRGVVAHPRRRRGAHPHRRGAGGGVPLRARAVPAARRRRRPRRRGTTRAPASARPMRCSTSATSTSWRSTRPAPSPPALWRCSTRTTARCASRPAWSATACTRSRGRSWTRRSAGTSRCRGVRTCARKSSVGVARPRRRRAVAARLGRAGLTAAQRRGGAASIASGLAT